MGGAYVLRAQITRVPYQTLCPLLCGYWAGIFKTPSTPSFNPYPLTDLAEGAAEETNLSQYKLNTSAFMSLILRRLNLLK